MIKIEIYGTPKKLWVGAWIMLGFLFAGVNGYSMMSLLDDPIPGPSSEVKTAGTKYRNLMDISEKKTRLTETEDWNRLQQKFKKKNASANAVIEKIEKAEREPHTDSAFLLPELSGILSVSGADGKSTQSAVLNGKIRVEQEEINGLKIMKIEARGVTLSRQNRSFFIPAPRVAFSISR